MKRNLDWLGDDVTVPEWPEWARYPLSHHYDMTILDGYLVTRYGLSVSPRYSIQTGDDVCRTKFWTHLDLGEMELGPGIIEVALMEDVL